MKRKLSKAGGKALSVALAMATVVSAAPFSVAAEDNVALAQTQETEGNALRLWYDEEAPNSYTGWEQWALPLGNSAIGAVGSSAWKQRDWSQCVWRCSDRANSVE